MPRDIYAEWQFDTLRPQNAKEQEVWDMEMLLRQHAGYDEPGPDFRPLTDDERARVVSETRWCSEGNEDPEPTWSDRELAHAWHEAVNDYVRGMF